LVRAVAEKSAAAFLFRYNPDTKSPFFRTLSPICSIFVDLQKIRRNAEKVSSMKTFICMAVIASCAAGHATALAQTDRIERVFAGCAGRYSAEMEHAWLMGDPEGDALQAQRSAFVSLLEAATPVGQERSVLAYRIDTKMAHASLLTLATFADNERQAERARLLSQQHLAQCRALLPGA
jgi:hypothetical protein